MIEVYVSIHTKIVLYKVLKCLLKQCKMIWLLIYFSLIVKNYFGAATESMIDIHSKVSLKNLRKGPYTNDVTSFLRFFENYLFREPVNRLKNLSNFKGLPELAEISGVHCRYRLFYYICLLWTREKKSTNSIVPNHLLLWWLGT